MYPTFPWSVHVFHQIYRNCKSDPRIKKTQTSDTDKDSSNKTGKKESKAVASAMFDVLVYYPLLYILVCGPW